MTNKEAIKELRDASDSEVRYGDTRHHYDEVIRRVEAFDMAIKALGRQDKIEDSNLSTEQYKADLQGAYDCGYNCGYADAMNDIAEREE